MVDRIKQIMKYKKMTSAAFAEAIDINRSNLTHLFSGRNQPSLDLVRKILNAFPEIRTEWLIMGVGSMFQNNEEVPHKEENNACQEPFSADLFSQKRESLSLFQEEEQKLSLDISVKEETMREKEAPEEVENELPQAQDSGMVIRNEEQMTYRAVSSPSVKKIPLQDSQNSDQPLGPSRISDSQVVKKVKKIVFFYADNTFETFYPEEEK